MAATVLTPGRERWIELTRTSRTSTYGLLMMGIVLLGVSLRGPIIAVTPILDTIARDLNLLPRTAGLLATLPVLAFAVFAPPAALVIRSLGPEVAIVLTLSAIAASQLVRAIPTTTTVVAGTIALGMAITVGNIAVPTLIQRDVPPHRVGSATGIYTATLNVGSLVTALLTAPLSERLGWSWALASWTVLAVVGVAFWAWRARVVSLEGPLNRVIVHIHTRVGAATARTARSIVSGAMGVRSVMAGLWSIREGTWSGCGSVRSGNRGR